MFSSGKSSITIKDILSITSEAEIVFKYLGINKIPCLINSPFRHDTKPSFGLYSPDGKSVNFRDFATNERGSVYLLLSRLWGISFPETLERIYLEVSRSNKSATISTSKHKAYIRSSIDLQCKIRDWQQHDIEYWESYGISLQWLKYANIYPISHKIIVKNGNRYVYGADKYAYVYVEFKEGHTSIKIYQPYNTKGFKWANNHNASVISLWTKVPKEGNIICICSSTKDALCLWANTGIPAIAIQAEGYSISQTAANELKRRFKDVFILLDNDETGVKDSIKLSEDTGFKNIILPRINNTKDISDLYKSLDDKNCFKNIMLNLFN